MKKDRRKYQIRRGDIADYPQHYHAPLELHYKGFKCMISAGGGDDITVFQEGKNFVVLITNFMLGYAGLDYIIFDHDGLTIDQNIFIQNTEEIETKKDFFDYTENSQADYLMQWIN